LFTLNQSLYVKGSGGDPLPTVWESLEKKGTRFLRGQLALICAGPGVGKSALVLTYALKAKVPTLYFSADSDAFTQLSRSVSIVTGWDMGRTTRMVRNEQLGETSKEFDNIPIRFIYDASPTPKRIETVMEAYWELYGDYPALAVIDNVTNVRTGGDNDDDPFAGLESLMDELHRMARVTGSCVIGLHHVTGKYNDACEPIPLSGVKGQIARVPEMVLTLHKISEQFGPASLRVSTVKNRADKSDPSGYDWTELDFWGDTMQIKDK
jgi:hypothetical protein